MTRTIVASAIRMPDGAVFHKDKPGRHSDVFKLITTTRPELHNRRGAFAGVEQGFLDDTGTFLTRKKAYLVARKAGQVEKKKPGRGILFSEDLW